jgi:hypothetical protein
VVATPPRLTPARALDAGAPPAVVSVMTARAA